jgi:hypothetical protein
VTLKLGKDLGWWLRAGLVVAIGWFYFWTAVPEWHPGLLGTRSDGYYNLLTRGFMKGHLYLDIAADPFLATLKNASDPAARGAHGMHDASYYRGHYYLYFGVAPVVLLFLPFRLLTGHFIDESLASPMFACVGLLASVWLLDRIRRRYFPGSAGWAAAGCVLALGLANMMPVLLRRSSVWEVPITCAYACGMVALGAIFEALHARHPGRWLALSGAALGCAVGSRPTYIFGCAAVLVPLWCEARRRGGLTSARRDAGWRRLALAALLPIAAIGLGLALYNQLRFGRPTDFGFRHLMNGEDVANEQLMGWRFLWYNLRVYALAPAGWSPYFPFVTVATLPPPPPGHLGAEDPYGILPNLPFALLALGAAGLALRRRSAEWAGLRAWILGATILLAGAGMMVTAFGGAINRYMVDFLPTLVVLACLGLLETVSRPWFRGWARAAAGTAIGVLLLYSALFNVLASYRHNELFHAEHPALYARIAHRWNWISYAIDRWRGTAYGPVEMKVVFPRDATGEIEPLVVTGRSFLSDYLFVHYLGTNSVRFGLVHTSRGTFTGQPVTLQPGEVHTLRIDLGSLYPPAAHPYFDRLPPAEARLRQREVRVTLDGQVAFERELELYDSNSLAPSIGSSGDRPGLVRPFTGRILSWRRMPEATLQPAKAQYGPLRLALVLPPFAGRRSEPLVCTGETGRGDLVYVRYESADRISFGYDHWSMGGSISAPLAVDPRANQVVEVDFGALAPATEEEEAGGAERGHLTVRLNGRPALDETAPFYPTEPYTVSVGVNSIQASSAAAMFSGALVKSEREAPGPTSAP